MPDAPNPRSPLDPRTPNLTTGLLIAALLLAGAPLAAESASYAGKTLAEALDELQARGLALFYTSQLVRPGMRVAAEPAAGGLEEVLEELLAPHGLTAEPGPGDRLVVVAAPPAPAGMRGLVRDRRSADPIPGVRILIRDAGRETLTGADGRFRLADLAAGSLWLEAHLPGYVVEAFEVTLEPGRVTDVLVELEPAQLALDEIVVTPSFISLLREDPVTGLALDRDDIFALPHLGDDIFRAMTLLPGVAGEEVSARFHVRGGRSDEVLMLLDRVELFEPFHLKDFGSAISIVTPRALREVNLITGGFPAEYGDRMSGVLDMSTVQAEETEVHLGLSLLTAEIGTAGTFDERRGDWITSLRRGQLDLALEMFGQQLKPKYWDGFAKTQYQLRPGHRLGLTALHSDDALDSLNVDAGDTEEDYDTSYGNSYLWLTHQAILGARLFADTVASFGHVHQDRQAKEKELLLDVEGAGFSLIDRRDLRVAGVKQDWNWQATQGHYLKWGFDARRLTTDYDYFNRRALDDPLEEIRFEPRTGTTRFARRLRGDQHSAYVSDRVRPVDALTFELGLRYDEHTVTRDANVSPRLNLVWAAGERSTLRFAWGYFFQSQRPYELQVEDGVTELTSAERTEQRVAGFERTFTRRGGSDLLLRVEAYHRRISHPRSRYENIYSPVEIFPEVEPDRVLFAPDEARAYGAEVFVRGSAGPRIGWWASYAWSRTEDSIDGRWLPRRIDQPHAVSFDVNYRAGRHWNVNLAWRYHTGWPTTSIHGVLEEDDEGELEVEPVLGPLHGERLPDYHRLDLRASREWRKGRGVLGFFVEIQNVYNRANVAGFDPDFEFGIGPDGQPVPVYAPEIWGRILPSFGITWQF